MRSLFTFAIVLYLPAIVYGEAPLPANGATTAPKNLVAWCVVPFDAAKRSPVERAAMLKRLGLTKLAYDYRAEHIPTFDAELDALAAYDIELFAWWFPTELNDEARLILKLLERRQAKTQLWVTGGGGAVANAAEQALRVQSEVARLRPIVDAAHRIGCKVGLYNHGGWFGEPENLVAVVKALNHPAVGIVYNQHHGHSHVDRWEAHLKLMQPYLLCLNLNGVDPAGDQQGRKILPLGAGQLDTTLFKVVQASGYQGPLGVMNHTDADAELRLLDNLEGLTALANGPSAKMPRWRTWPTPVDEATQQLDANSAPYDSAQMLAVAAGAMSSGEAGRGAVLFASSKLACLSCHRIGKLGGLVGPELTRIGSQRLPHQLAESLLWPQRDVSAAHFATNLVLEDGRALRGIIDSETATEVILRDPVTQEKTTLPTHSIEERVPVGSVMPSQLASTLTREQQFDLVRFLSELGHPQSPSLESIENTLARAQTHRAETFEFVRDPLFPQEWPSWQAHINRDRLYDFYTKQAEWLRSPRHRPELVMEYPDLDGGKYGHWGNQNEASWKDNRWNETDVGVVHAGVIHKAGKQPISRGVAVRLGETSTCFDPDRLNYPAIWTGDFLKFSDVRHGLMSGVEVGGVLAGDDLTAPTGDFEYRGYYRDGDRIAFAYRSEGRDWLDAPMLQDGKFVRLRAPADEHPWGTIRQGGAPLWPQTFTVKGTLGVGGPYVVDTIPLPFDNPWKALMFCGDHDFLPDGTAVVCTMHGDVWTVSGLDATLEAVTWRRFASGLHQPLGLVVSEGQIYVLGRDQITRLHDLNQDGEADFYESFSRALKTSPAGHDYTCGLHRGPDGAFYTASQAEGVMRIEADGQRAHVLARGFRNPDGLGLWPDGMVTVPCSEGEWTPASMLCAVPAGPIVPADQTPHFGYRGPIHGHPPATPFVYLPRGLDNSSGGQIAVTSDAWGPLKGQMLHFSYGTGSHFLLLRDQVGDVLQGAVSPRVGEFLSGSHRGRFHPIDGQLYVSGMQGWGCYTPDDGCFQRVRYTGSRVQSPSGFHVHQNGVVIHFTAPLDPAVANDASQQVVQCWNYRYGPGYGSPEFSTVHRGVRGHDVLRVAGVKMLDEKTLFVELPDLQPVNVLFLSLKVDAGRPQELFATVNAMDAPHPSGKVVPNKLVQAHPLQVDVQTLAARKPNPWQRKDPKARKITVEAGQNLQFVQRTLEAKAGEKVQLTFHNPDVVPHNWVLLKPGSLARVGELTNRLIADPDAYARQYVPESPDVLIYTDITDPLDHISIVFEMPQTPGRYPYLCTFPGHWMVMNGELIVSP